MNQIIQITNHSFEMIMRSFKVNDANLMHFDKFKKFKKSLKDLETIKEFNFRMQSSRQLIKDFSQWMNQLKRSDKI